MRIKLHGLYDEDGNILRPNVVRVGVLDKNPNDIIKNCALENLAEFEMNKLKPKSPLKVINRSLLIYSLGAKDHGRNQG